jgi:hypothetical protein
MFSWWNFYPTAKPDPEPEEASPSSPQCRHEPVMHDLSPRTWCKICEIYMITDESGRIVVDEEREARRAAEAKATKAEVRTEETAPLSPDEPGEDEDDDDDFKVFGWV